jgi:XTP/dITP diphosphohydrolase
MTRLVLATGNRGKVREMAAILADLGLEVIAQNELGVVPVEETGTTFEANALLKARHAAAATGCAALADDSGLEVDALDGAPGVYSARYAGPGATDEANNDKLLAALEGVPAPRRARYRCVLAFVRDAADPEPLIASGSWEGEITSAPRGSGGFGYDPLFVVAGDPAGRTAALLDPPEKNRISHRAKALAELRERLARLLAPAGGPG